MRRDAATAKTLLLIGSDAATLITCRPRASLVSGLAHPHGWVAASGTDAAGAELAAVLLWLVACWLGIGLLACGLGRLPGLIGATGGRLARLVLPRALYRLAAGATGLGITLTPVAASAHPVGASSAPAVHTAPQWPSSDGATPHVPGWPTAHRTPERTTANAPARHHHPGDHQPSPDPARIVVHRGESLWQIAAAHLPGRPSTARVAAAWPRWYAANRRVIGDDPNLIQPGQMLHSPPEGPRS